MVEAMVTQGTIGGLVKSILQCSIDLQSKGTTRLFQGFSQMQALGDKDGIRFQFELTGIDSAINMEEKCGLVEISSVGETFGIMSTSSTVSMGLAVCQPLSTRSSRWCQVFI